MLAAFTRLSRLTRRTFAARLARFTLFATTFGLLLAALEPIAAAATAAEVAITIIELALALLLTAALLAAIALLLAGELALAFNILGDALRDRLDPRLKSA